MIKIEFPKPGFKVRENQGFEEIFDPLRKSWVKLTPEEWVRQNFVQYLVQTAQIPSSLIAVEREIRIGELKKRFDLVVFDRTGTPWMLVECKSMDTPLSSLTISQTLSYITTVPCTFMLVSNGSYTYGWQLLATGFLPLESFPTFPLKEIQSI